MKTTKKCGKVLLAGMAVMALAFGLVVVGCDDGGNGGGSSGNTDPKSITITGITGLTGQVTVAVVSSFYGGAGIFVGGMGVGTIASGTVTVALQDQNGQNWTGTGDYLVGIFDGGTTTYVYTDGKTLTDLGITSVASTAPNDGESKLPKLNINSASTTVAFNKFCLGI